MPITHIADRYLTAFNSNEEFDGGLSFREALQQSELDYTPESLKRIDDLLDEIRNRLVPDPRQFLNDQANVNFLYLLAFYVGRVVADETGANIEWYPYDEMVQLFPENRAFFPNCFGSSVTCVLSGGRRGGGWFVPLSAIETRLYEEEPDKSVWFSAGAFM
jgi:hypothetical protein